MTFDLLNFTKNTHVKYLFIIKTVTIEILSDSKKE